MMLHKPTISMNGGTNRVLLLCIVALLCMGALATPVLAAAPVAAFSGTPTSGNSPLTVLFTDTSTGDPTSRVWDFGDGNSTWSTTATSVAHTFTTSGYYTVKLTVTNGEGSDDEIKTNYITATCNLQINSISVPNSGPALFFANEPNPILVQNIKCAEGNCPATEIQVTVSDFGWTGRAVVPAMSAGTSTNIQVTDPTLRTAESAGVSITAVVDPDNAVPETLETDNTKINSKAVKFNGYKGVQYWNGKTAPQTYLTYDISGDVIHSFGDSQYKSGKGSTWPMLAWTWSTGTDPDPDDSDTPINIPAGATIKAARLYIPYCWDYEKEISGGLTTTKFNGVTVTPVHMETDVSNFGAYEQYEYGLVTYDVTSLYVKNSTNVVQFYRYYDGVNHTSPYLSGQPGSLSPAGFTLMIVYEDQTATRKQILINEGWDLLGASTASYGTTEAEATSYQEFTGMTIDMGSAAKADLTTFVPWGTPMSTGDTGEGNLYVNGVQLGHNVWNYGGADTWGENGLPQVAVDKRDILSNLNSGGTGNQIAIQSTAGASPCMVAERAFLVVEYPTAPYAAFSADDTTPDVGQIVTFTDESTNSPASWAWTIEGTAGTDYQYVDSTSSTSQNPHVQFLVAGTYDVTLVATNAAGSDDELKTGYITATAGLTPVPLPGFTNPPTDPDSDGLYEDLNANSRKDFNDIYQFYKYMAWMSANEPVALFDFNGNNRLDFNDIYVLYKEMV